ncbi:MAG: hypothetical protein R6V53_04405 [Candidatus Woesearchaeota archaeon]
MILLLPAPASALRLGLNFNAGDNPEIAPGETLGFTVSADLEKINNNEEVINTDSTIQVVILDDGEPVTDCSFDLEGNLQDCDEADFPLLVGNNNANHITDGTYYLYGYGKESGQGNEPASYKYINFFKGYSSGEGYGYMPGYGYNDSYGELSYDIAWKTGEPGNYEVAVYLITPTNRNEYFVFQSEEPKFFTVKASASNLSEDISEEPSENLSEDISDSNMSDSMPDNVSTDLSDNVSDGDDESIGNETAAEEANATVSASQNVLDNALANKNVPEDVKERLALVAENLENIISRSKTDVFAGDEVNNLGNIMQLQDLMADDIELVVVNELEREDKTLGDMPDEVKESVLQKVEGGENKFLFDRSDVRKKAKVTTVMTQAGEARSLVELTFEVSAGDHVVEIPKALAANASEIQGVFKVIEEDPILLFEDTDTIEMSLATDVDKVEELDSEADNIRIASLEEDQPVQAIETPDEGNETTSDETAPLGSGFEWLVGVLLLIVILGAIVLVVYSRTRGNKPDFEVK